MSRNQDWGVDAFEALVESDICQVSYVPDAGLSKLLDLCCRRKEMISTLLTSEEEGIGLAAGAWLGGDRSALLMQSSGVGNCMNALSLIQTCRFPLLMIVTMRGEWKEFNPWQLPMGQGAEGYLKHAGVIVSRVDEVNETKEIVNASADLAFDSLCAVAVLISQRVIGAKRFTGESE